MKHLVIIGVLVRLLYTSYGQRSREDRLGQGTDQGEMHAMLLPRNHAPIIIVLLIAVPPEIAR